MKQASNTKKILSFALIAIAILNLLLFAFTVYDQTIFWIILIITAAATYIIIPKIS